MTCNDPLKIHRIPDDEDQPWKIDEHEEENNSEEGVDTVGVVVVVFVMRNVLLLPDQARQPQVGEDQDDHWQGCP